MVSSSAKYAVIAGIIAVIVGIGLSVMPSLSSTASAQMSQTPTETTNVAPGVGRSVALVMVASIDDQGFGTKHYEGLLELRDRLGYEISFSEKVSPAQWEDATRNYAELGYNYVIMGGAQFTSVAAQIAPDYPETTFMVTVAVHDPERPYPPNMIGLDSANEQSGYLAGILAGGMTKTNRVGIVAGVDFPNVIRWNEAFKLGAVTQNPNVTIFEVFTGDFNDITKGYEAAKSQIDSGADIIWQYLNLGAVGAVNAIKEKPGVWHIGNIDDQSFLAPEVTLTSAMNNFDTLVVQAVEAHNAGEIGGGEFHRWGIEAGVVGLAPYHQTEGMIPADLKAKIEDLKMQMTNGTFTVPEIYEKDGYRNFL
jgi:basic membrane lipoprotein Med (substrate-binding protein (PBP1-ABC) superfamily)